MPTDPKKKKKQQKKLTKLVNKRTKLTEKEIKGPFKKLRTKIKTKRIKNIQKKINTNPIALKNKRDGDTKKNTQKKRIDRNKNLRNLWRESQPLGTSPVPKMSGDKYNQK